ncbi:hypothetical protein C5612_15785 [Pseudomonas frederiksbergensis]|uniref:Amino acid permease n=1 Tax=Pseudomonas frederiksbergensis TaxID=104087 RepID=A0A2S8HLA7_9PSED|nr:hypothetical protein C5612_15785 [Pseudomonas frederiksbergensis]
MIAGLATLIEFVFAPPAIALAIGAYLNVQFPALDPKHAAVGAYVVFMGLNILGVKLAIEGAAMAAEEAKDPKRTILKAYISGILTLVLLAMGVMFFAGGVGDWRTLSNINDPLPQAMKAVVGESSGWLHMLVWIGLFGLVAMAWFNALIGLIFLGFMAVGFVYFMLTAQLRADAPADAMLTGL